MALTNDFKVKNGLTVIDSISAGGNLSAVDGFFHDDLTYEGTLFNGIREEYTNSNIIRVNQFYTGGSSGSYFTAGEYQKVVTIDPSGSSENYQVIGSYQVQNAGTIQTVNFSATVRSNTLPNLAYEIFTEEKNNGTRYVKPVLWTKETSPASVIVAFEVLAGPIYGTVTADIDIIPRSAALKSNVTMNNVQNSEQSSVESGYTQREATIRTGFDQGNVGIGTTSPSFTSGGGLQITNATQANLRLSDSSNASYNLDLAMSNDDFYLVNRSATGHLKFRVNNSTEAITVLQDGNVGIGTTAPDNKLTVSGAISATGNISTTGNILSAGVNIDQLFGTSGGGDITAVTTGPYLTGGGASGSVEVGIDSACAAAWDAAVAGDISAVVAGTGLTGGGTSGSVTLNISAGDGVQATANCVSVDSTVIRTTGGQTIDNTLVISSGTSGDANLCIVSDTDNNNENDTGCILFVQDGGATQAAIGQNGATSQYTGALANAAYFGSIGNNPVQFIQSDTARLTIENGGNVGIGITNPTYKFQVTSADASDDVAYIHHDNASQSSGTVLKVRSDAGDSSGYSLLDVQNNTGNALYVGGNRSVGIGTTSPSEELTVAGSISAQDTTYSNQFQTPNTANCGFWVTGNTVHSGMYNGGGLATLSFKSNAGRTLQLINNSGQKRVQVESDGELGFGTDNTFKRASSSLLTLDTSLSAQNCIIGEQIVKRGGTSSQFLKADGSVDSTSYGIGDITAVTAGTGLTGGGTSGSVTLNISAGDGVQATANCVSVDSTVVRTTGTQSIGGSKTFTSDICIANKIIHDGDSNTFFQLANDIAVINTGGEEHLRANNSGIVINEGGLANDFRVEGDTDTHALFVDGSADRVGIGTTSPATKLHVAGNSLVTGDSTIYGNLSVTGDFTCLETTISTTSALSVTNTGTGPALFVCQAGVQPIAHFIDANGDDIVFADDGKVGIGTFNPAEELTVSGTISASEFVYVGEKKAVSSDDINFIVKVTQAEYDALTPDSGTLYIITDENTNSPVINPITTVTANYTVTDEDHTILTNGSSVLNVGLPSAVTNSNYVYNVKNVSTNAITISAAAGNIDGQSSQAICQQFENITVQSDGSNWFII